jgi:hypothetical protein
MGVEASAPLPNPATTVVSNSTVIGGNNNENQNKQTTTNSNVSSSINNIKTAIIIAPNGVHRNWVDLEIPKHMPEETNCLAYAWDNFSTKESSKNLLFSDLISTVILLFPASRVAKPKPVIDLIIEQRYYKFDSSRR